MITTQPEQLIVHESIAARRQAAKARRAALWRRAAVPILLQLAGCMVVFGFWVFWWQYLMRVNPY